MELLSNPLPVPPRPEPDPVAVKQFADEMESRRLAWELARPARLAAIEAGPSLADPDAAADCRCACHPRPAESLHTGGVECSCQPETPQRRQRRREALAALFADDFGLGEFQEERRNEFFAAAQRLGVSVVLECEACPVSFRGVLDGFRFAVRERHDEFRVVVDPTPVAAITADLPALPDLADPSDVADSLVDDDGFGVFTPGVLLVSSGPVSVLEDASLAGLLTESVGVLRTWLRRSACTHERGPSDALFCCDCGASLGPSDG